MEIKTKDDFELERALIIKVIKVGLPIHLNDISADSISEMFYWDCHNQNKPEIALFKGHPWKKDPLPISPKMWQFFP